MFTERSNVCRHTPAHDARESSILYALKAVVFMQGFSHRHVLGFVVGLRSLEPSTVSQ